MRLLQERSVIWRTPKDATTSSAERQGLDYEQPNKAETATKGSGITPQSTSSDSKDTTISPTTNELGEKSAAPSVQEQIQAAEAEVNTNPTEAQKEAGREPQRRQEGAVTDAEIEALNAEISENYRTNSELDKDNERFNNELQQQIDGTLPKGDISIRWVCPARYFLVQEFPICLLKCPQHVLKRNQNKITIRLKYQS